MIIDTDELKKQVESEAAKLRELVNNNPKQYPNKEKSLSYISEDLGRTSAIIGSVEILAKQYSLYGKTIIE